MGRPTTFELPNKAKIAVSFFVAFEAFNKYSQYRRGGDKLDYANDLSLLFVHKNPPSVYFESYRRAFDLLYSEGEAGRPKVMDALVHAHIGGRANIAGVFEECIRYTKGFTDVWFCTKGEIAKWYLEHYVNKSHISKT